MNLLKVLNSLSDTNASIKENIYTTTIQSTLEYHRLASRQLEDPIQLQRDDSASYECRIYWTREETEILKQGSREYIRSQPDNNTYYTTVQVTGNGWRRQFYTRKKKY